MSTEKKGIGIRDAQIAEAYLRGDPMASLCKRFGLKERTIHQILAANEARLPERVCPKRSRQSCLSPRIRAEEIAMRAEEGYTHETIGKAYTLSTSAIKLIVSQVAKGHVFSTRFIKQTLDPEEKQAVQEVSAMRAELGRRLALQRYIDGDDKQRSKRRAVEKERCRRDVVYFINNWGWTHDPRRAAYGQPEWIPFTLVPRQVEMLRFIEDRLRRLEEGLIEKSREVGFSWVAIAFAVHRWIFVSGFKTMFGSYHEDKVDALGNLDSLLEKARQFRDRVPEWLKPKDFYAPDHDNQNRIINPDNGNTITGEVGDNIGRGGRSTLVFIDEAAHVARAERAAAALSANANTRIWASSVNGMGNLFARKRHDGSLRQDQIFRFHWRDMPLITQEHIERKKKELAATPWIYFAEYEIDYTASVEGVCIMGKWVDAAVRLYKWLAEHQPAQLKPNGRPVAGLDIGGGKAQSVLIARRDHVVDMPDYWGEPDTTETAYRALDIAQKKGVATLYFDEVGMGKGVLSILTINETPGLFKKGINTGTPPSLTMWEDEKNSRQKFANLKAELWWLMRERFKCTWEHMNHLERLEENAVEHLISDLIVLPPEATDLITQLSLLRSFRNERGKVIMETKSQLATRGVSSPDQADALALTFVPGNDAVPFVVPFISEVPRPDPWAPQW